MAADQETVDRVRSIDVDAYKYGFVSRDRVGSGSKGPERRYGPVHFAEERRAGMAAGMAARGLPSLANDGRAEMGARQLIRRSTIRTSTISRRRNPAPRQSRSTRSIPELSAHLRQARHPAGRAGDSRRGREDLGGGRRRFRFGFDRDDLQGGARQGRSHFLLLLRGGPKSPRPRAPLPRHGRAQHGQLLRDAQFGGVLRRLLCLRAAGRALPDGAFDLFPHQREEHRAI